MSARAGLARALGIGLAALACQASCECGGAARSPPTRIGSELVQAPSESESEDDARKRGCLAELLPAPSTEHEALYRALCSEWVEREVPGVALAIVEPGGDAVHIELGQRCAGAPEPVTRETPFRLGSLSKPITAALALGLVAEGRLADDTAASVVEGYVDQAGLPTPTLATLLRHRSGLGEIEPARLVELEGAWRPALGGSPSAGSPGEFHYSNSGYVVVGAMIEVTLALPYDAALRQRIAAPLGLDSVTADAQVEGSACGHLADDPERQPIAVREDLAFMPGDPSWLEPAGGVLASAEGLARFALELGGARLPGSAAMLEPGEPIPAAGPRRPRPDERYGAGLRSWRLADGSRAYGHSGNNVAFAAELMFVPGRRAIVVLSNTGEPLAATYAAAAQLLQTEQ